MPTSSSPTDKENLDENVSPEQTGNDPLRTADVASTYAKAFASEAIRHIKSGTDANKGGTDANKGDQHGLVHRVRDFANYEISTLMGGFGLFVFVTASIVGLLILIVLSITMDDLPIRGLTLVEVSLRIGAVGLLLGLLSGIRNSFVVAFGILLVAALIVTPKELTRMVLLVTGSDKRIERYFTASSRGVEYTGRLPSLATKIVAELDAAEGLAEGMRRKSVTSFVSCLLRNERIELSKERLSISGAIGPFEAIYMGKFHEFLYINKDEDQLVTDLLSLRSSGLIRFDYQQHDQAVLTDYGTTVIESIGQSAPTSCNLWRVETLASISLTYACPSDSVVEQLRTINIGERVDLLLLRDPGETYILDAGSDPINLQLDLVGAEGVDPVLDVLTYVGNESCATAYNNDDYSEGLDARIDIDSATGKYLIRVSAYEHQVGNAQLSVTSP